MKNHKRYLALDFARVCSMLAVMMIHVTSTYIRLPSSKTILDMNLAFLLNQASRFSVPLFLLLSGVSLSLIQEQNFCQSTLSAHKSISGRQSAASGLFRFYRHRFCKLLPPYWFWSTVYFLFGNNWKLSSLWSPFYLRSLMLGMAGPHLYFIVILAQCYLLYPLIKNWCSRNTGLCLLTWFLALFCATQFILFRKQGLPLLPPKAWHYFGLSLLLWGFCFVLGVSITPARLARLQQDIEAAPLLFPVLGTVLCVLCILEARATGYLDTDRLSLFLYACLSFPAFLSFWIVLGKISTVQWMTGCLARHSMTMYYCHVLLLTLFRRSILFSGFSGTLGFLRLYCAVFLSSFAVSAVLDAVPSVLKRYVVPFFGLSSNK